MVMVGLDIGILGFTCGKPELFHNLHRFIHRVFPQHFYRDYPLSVDIKLLAIFDKFPTFSHVKKTTTPTPKSEKKDLTRFFPTSSLPRSCQINGCLAVLAPLAAKPIDAVRLPPAIDLFESAAQSTTLGPLYEGAVTRTA